MRLNSIQTLLHPQFDNVVRARQPTPISPQNGQRQISALSGRVLLLLGHVLYFSKFVCKPTVEAHHFGALGCRQFGRVKKKPAQLLAWALVGCPVPMAESLAAVLHSPLSSLSALLLPCVMVSTSPILHVDHADNDGFDTSGRPICTSSTA